MDFTTATPDQLAAENVRLSADYIAACKRFNEEVADLDENDPRREELASPRRDLKAQRGALAEAAAGKLSLSNDPAALAARVRELAPKLKDKALLGPPRDKLYLEDLALTHRLRQHAEAAGKKARAETLKALGVAGTDYESLSVAELNEAADGLELKSLALVEERQRLAAVRLRKNRQDNLTARTEGMVKRAKPEDMPSVVEAALTRAKPEDLPALRDMIDRMIADGKVGSDPDAPAPITVTPKPVESKGSARLGLGK